MRCPVCRAQVEQGPQCRRCRADLALLFRLKHQRQKALAAARGHLTRGDLRRALEFVARAHAWRPDDDSRQLLAVLHLLRRDYARAWRAAASHVPTDPEREY